ncbi:hypothetical protein LOK74_01435 [Brevibacillus humidisoli]|uniref:hypothetical protein n=1 Tax=Brevibacillus humidisoli TaxID=2895522 RepID=UPI001E527266|nr:hypothetical protein [Brevibacillus humidisoli]UFJ41244.1 hypothetical protein LOK74_01435 [Brevibacillus humidisoli]
MIDTVRMYGDYHIDYNKIDSLPWTHTYTFEHQEDIGMLGEVREYKKKDSPLYIKYSVDTRRLVVEVSIPKFLYGNNITMITDGDIPIFFRKLNNYLWDNFYLLPRHDSAYWIVTRMDVCWNFQVGGAVREYIDVFGQIHIPKYTTRVYGDRETVEWMNKSIRMSFYDKERELIARKGSKEIIESARGVLRFECNVRNSNQLKKYSMNRWAGELLCGKVAKQILATYLQRIGVDKALPTSNTFEQAKQLIDAYGVVKAEQLMGFLLMNDLYGQEFVRKSYTTSTLTRRMDDLKKAGIAPFFSDKELPPLDLSFLKLS